MTAIGAAGVRRVLRGVDDDIGAAALREYSPSGREIARHHMTDAAGL
jgi:hypothetical protein